MIEDYLKSLNPRSPDLVYNAQYHLWLNGEYLGVATWTQDENVGDSFQQMVMKDDLLINQVFLPDRWELIVKRRNNAT
jgi:hypothetical protein